MVSPSLNTIKTNLLLNFGLDFDVSFEVSDDGEWLILDPKDLGDPEGFKIFLQLDWRKFVGEFKLGDFAGELLRAIEANALFRREIFDAYINIIENHGGKIDILINGESYDPDDSVNFPENWQNLNITVEKKNVVINNSDISQVTMLMEEWSSRMVGLLASILPIHNIDYAEHQIKEGLAEGSKYQVTTNRYERNHLNRQVCIELHGYACGVCGFNFEEIYGKLGTGFIHVHHKIPVSQIGAGYLIDPLNDLIPVCPNCHAMLHKENPPITPEDLKAKLK